MKRLLYFSLLFWAWGQMSCSNDLGNYDYSRLPELKVDGIEEDYGTRVMYKDSLIIEPGITFGTEDLDSFEMEWYEVRDSLVFICKGKDLRILPNKAGEINYLFKVKHKTYGLSTYVKTKVTMTSAMARGVYILKETADGNTEIDGHIRKDLDSYEFYPNLIAKQLGKPMEGKPVALDYWDWFHLDEGTGNMVKERVFRPASEKDIAVFRVNDFKHLGGLAELFYDVRPGDLHIEGLKSAEGTTMLVYNNGRVRAMPNHQEVSHFFMEFIGDYELGPMIASTDRGWVLIYDNLSSSFKAMNGTYSFFQKLSDWFPYDRQNPVRKMNDLNARLVTMVRAHGGAILNRNKGVSYALLSRNDHPGSMLLYHVDMQAFYGGTFGSLSPCGKIDTLPENLNLTRSRMFSAHEYDKILFFVLDNRVYTMNINTFEEIPLIVESDYPEGKVPDEITYIKYIACEYDDKPYNFDRLFVGGYKNGRYMLYAFELEGGKIMGEPLVWEGEGKIKDIRYTTASAQVNELFIWQ